MSSSSILFIAPAQAVLNIFPLLKEAGLEAGMAENLSGALGFIKKARPALVLSRPWLPGYKIENLLAQAAADPDFPRIIVFTEKGSADDARRLMELGAHDYWLEPLAWEKIEAALPAQPASPLASGAAPAAASASQPRPAAPQAKSGGLTIIGRHPAVARVLALARQVAPSKATVLIAGESGTGKEMFARFLHQHSDRHDKPFVAINCAALPEHLLESELFGHEKGSFTGAISRKLGKFELANGGTLLLDEISEMELGLQAKLLRVLQESELDRVGGVETVKVDVRVLATTNRKLEEWVKEGKFRQDLYFRLNVIPLTLPPLKDRAEDAILLAQFFIRKFCDQYGLAPIALSQEAVDWIVGYDWPGNVRELQNLMERAVLLAGKGPIAKSHFLLDPDAWPLPEDAAVVANEAALTAPTAPITADGADPGVSMDNMLAGGVIPLQELERIMILKGLEQTSGNRTQAAELLGISVRTLRNKLNEYRSQGLDV
ncbi:MAG: sigma-54 dependent transcriptional regulator [Desulfovibrionaceae bacterium]